MNTKLTDEILEHLWVLREKGSKSYNELVNDMKDGDIHNAILKMEKAGLITLTNDSIELSAKGETRARDLTRRHRLAERLFYDVFEAEMEEAEYTACEVEHILSPAVTDSVCSFLGHPPTCPHGKAIPKGECCFKYSREVKPLVSQLNDLEVGSAARIVFITLHKDKSSGLQRLASMGIVPGSIIKLKQKAPAFVLEIDETTLAIDSPIAKEIYVKRLGFADKKG
ncbi:MAG: metal-dependent transcriptional regulator [Nitrospirae bacterium]|nr:metal-dependent transcriptional regulator [Nitrospirota bacterium]